MNARQTLRLSLLAAALGSAASSSAITYKMTVSNSMPGSRPYTGVKLVFNNYGAGIVDPSIASPGNGTITAAYEWGFYASFDPAPHGSDVVAYFDCDSGIVGWDGGIWYANGPIENIDSSEVRLEAVPEPASIAALGLGAAAMLRRRKRA